MAALRSGRSLRHRLRHRRQISMCHNPPLLPRCGVRRTVLHVSRNMGWRYEVIVLGCVTLVVFFLRYFVFPFHESPKFLISSGKEAEVIEVLHKIAKFNKAPPPTLTLEDFNLIEEAAGPLTSKKTKKQVMSSFLYSFQNLKGIFLKSSNASSSCSWPSHTW